MKQLLLFLFFLFPIIGSSQPPRRSYTNVGLQYVKVTELIEGFNDGVFWGINAGTQTPVFSSPIEIGFDYSWGNIDSEDRDFVISYYQTFTGQYSYNNATMRFRNSNNRALCNIRIKPFNGPLQPYIDWVGGFESYRVSSDIITLEGGYSSTTGSNFQYFDITEVYGWSAGLRISSNEKLFVDFKIQNLKSGPVDYIDLNTITIINSQSINYTIKEITPKKFVYQVGLSYTY
jgi:hypothetical protein